MTGARKHSTNNIQEQKGGVGRGKSKNTSYSPSLQPTNTDWETVASAFTTNWAKKILYFHGALKKGSISSYEFKGKLTLLKIKPVMPYFFQWHTSSSHLRALPPPPSPAATACKTVKMLSHRKSTTEITSFLNLLSEYRVFFPNRRKESQQLHHRWRRTSSQTRRTSSLRVNRTRLQVIGKTVKAPKRSRAPYL